MKVGEHMKKLIRWGVVLAAVFQLCFGLSLPKEKKVITVKAMAVSKQDAITDIFGRLRTPMLAAGDDYWHAVGDALQELDTIEGASYDPQRGIITIHGKPSSGIGPFHLDDFITALRAAYFEKESLGMTIDPDLKNPLGPTMVVRYFAGCQDTAFGWILFECDRLMKSLANGQDNLSHEAMKPSISDFHNMLELGMALGDSAKDEWNRFWLTSDILEGASWQQKPQKSDGYQPVAFITEDQNSISILHCRLYVRTEVMNLKNGVLETSSGKASKSAEYFARHLSQNFEEFAKAFPVFARAAALERLVVLAEWMAKSPIPVDLQFIRNYRPQVPVITPRTTMTGTASLEEREEIPGGIKIRTIKIFGGVDLRPRTFFASDKDGNAAKQRELLQTNIDKHKNEVTWTVPTPEGPIRMIALPSVATRGSSPIAQSARRESVGRETILLEFRNPKTPDEIPAVLPNPSEIAQSSRIEIVKRELVSLHDLDDLRQQQTRGPPSSQLVLVDERKEKIGRETIDLNQRAPEVYSPVHPIAKGFTPGSDRTERIERENIALNDTASKPWGMPIFQFAQDHWTYNFPRLIEHRSSRVKRTVGIEGKTGSQIEAADILTIQSEIGDIALQFGEPQIDRKRVVFYYPPRSGNPDNIVGYYPKTRTLEFTDQSRIKFDKNGFPIEVAIHEAAAPQPTLFTFTYGSTAHHKGEWPNPISCSVKSAGARAESGVYRLTKEPKANAAH
jgi:hypothetical protein